MATDFSPAYLERARKNLPRQLKAHITLAPWIKRWRLLCLRYGSKKVYASAARPEVTTRLEAASAHFQKNKWAFVEDIFSKVFHEELLRNWPKKRYFEPPREVEKSYNTGFGWIYGQSAASDFSYFDPYGQYPTFRNLLNYVRSDEMARRMTAFVGRGFDLVCYSVTLTDAFAGSEVIPHRDGIAHDEKAKIFANLVFFIDATGGKNSGGLCLSRDNELNDLIFEPAKLTNTCLIYDSIADFYHGFAPIASGKFRWTIAIQFCDKRYIQKDKK